MRPFIEFVNTKKTIELYKYSYHYQDRVRWLLRGDGFYWSPGILGPPHLFETCQGREWGNKIMLKDYACPAYGGVNPV